MTEDEARAALEKVLWELPTWLYDPEHVKSGEQLPQHFQVIKERNVRAVAEGLVDLMEYFDIDKNF